MSNPTSSIGASSATRASCPVPSLDNCAGRRWGGEVCSTVGVGVRQDLAGVGDPEGVCDPLGPATLSPLPLALPSVPVLLWDRQHRPQLPGGPLPVPRGLWCPVPGHPQWGGRLRDSGHW